MLGGAGEHLQSMNYDLHSGMLARMQSANSGGADALAGGLMSRGAAVGRPMLSGAMGMLGLDPMSLGLKAGMSAWSSGAGVLGAGLAGAGVAAGVGVLGLGAAYVGNQMYSGAQQQLALNQGMRQNYNFINSQGGMGFTSNQGYQIGSNIRGMTHEFGPSGEVASFGELSRLAANMGRTGMGQNVRTVAEFKEKFKEMVDTLKKVAHDMGSSLEEAQKFVQSMKGSGIFRTADQLKMSQGTRIAAAAGGLAMSEVTGMANIGSQISRSVGGLGRQGAMGGMKTIEQIGLAQKVGAISEEDIYNATGLTGAEGRQALATSQMQQSARFLSTGRGRRFLASVAGKDGQLNEQAAMEYMMGGNVSTSRTMELAHQNLEGVGRANFIRNEGRLRGAALEKFGGLAQSLVYKQWLSSRGYDPTSMDDKAMLAFQRFSGMGRDDADTAIKQIRKIPEMMQEMRQAKGELAYSDEINKYNKSVGVEGLKRKFAQTQEKIQGHFQQAGSDIMQEGSDLLAQWFNRIMGVYERRQIEGVTEVMRMSKTGHVGAGREVDRLIHGTKMPGADKLGLGNQKGLGGGGSGFSALMNMSNAMSMTEGAQATKRDVDLVGAGGGRAFRDSFTDRASGLGGRARADAIRDIVKDQGGGASKDWLKEYEAADENKKLQMSARLEKAGGVSEGAQMSKTLTMNNLSVNDAGTSGWRKYLGIGAASGATEGEINKMIGHGRIKTEKNSSTMAKRAGQDVLTNIGLGPLGGIVNAYRSVSNYFSDQADDEAAGAWMKTKDAQMMMTGIAEGKGAEYDAAMARIQELNTKTAKGGELDRSEKTQLEMLQSARAGRELGVYLTTGAGKGKSVDQLSDEEKKQIAAQASKRLNREVSFDEVLNGARAIGTALDANQQSAVRQMREQTQVEIKSLKSEMETSGVATIDPNTGKLVLDAKRLEKMDPAARETYEMMSKIANTQFSGKASEDVEALTQIHGSATNVGLYSQAQNKVSDMSLAQKRKLAKSGYGPVEQMAAISAAKEERLENQIKRTNAGPAQTEVAMASLMGIDVTKEMRGQMASGSVDEVAMLMMKQQGVGMGDTGASKYKEQLMASIKAAREGKTGKAADLLSGAEGGLEGTAAGKKLEKFREGKMSPQEQSAKHLSKLAENSDKQLTALSDIATKLDKKDNPDGKGNTQTTPAPGGAKPAGG